MGTNIKKEVKKVLGEAGAEIKKLEGEAAAEFEKLESEFKTLKTDVTEIEAGKMPWDLNAPGSPVIAPAVIAPEVTDTVSDPAAVDSTDVAPAVVEPEIQKVEGELSDLAKKCIAWFDGAGHGLVIMGFSIRTIVAKMLHGIEEDFSSEHISELFKKVPADLFKTGRIRDIVKFF